MAELPALEELLLSGYDVSALLAGAPAQGAGVAGLLGLEAQVQLKAPALPQQTLGWSAAASADQNDLYQKVAQSLVAKLEEHRLQQVQMATALQQLQALQQQQELAQLQQQLSALHQHVPRTANPFQRSRTTDLESLGRGPSFDVTSAYANALDFEQQQKQLAALQQAANPAAHIVSLQRVPGVVGQHNLPVRSFSSEHLVVGQRRTSTQMPASASGQTMQLQGNSKKPPIRQPSGLGPNGRNGPNSRNGVEGGRRARYAATAKAPSWASEDWHPMKAVIASGAQASGGTGVFLPHLSGPSGAAAASSGSSGSSGRASALSSGNNGKATGGSGGSTASRLQERISGESNAVASMAGAAAPPPKGVGGAHFNGISSASGACAGLSFVHMQPPLPPPRQLPSPMSPNADGSPSCSVDSNAICSTIGGCDPYSRQGTVDFSRGSTHSELDSHAASSLGYLVDTMKVVVEEPEREREDSTEECDFVSLARELAELMSKQVIAE